MKSELGSIEIRAAAEGDVKAIYELLADYALKQIVLPRTEADIRYYLGNFTVCLKDGKLIGCMAVRDFGNQLFEVRSLVICPDFQGLGIGTKLVAGAIANLKKRFDSFRLFALTYRSHFFINSGFEKVEKELFPEKIWSDCMLCPKRDNCDEEAVLYTVN